MVVHKSQGVSVQEIQAPPLADEEPSQSMKNPDQSDRGIWPNSPEETLDIGMKVDPLDEFTFGDGEEDL